MPCSISSHVLPNNSQPSECPFPNVVNVVVDKHCLSIIACSLPCRNCSCNMMRGPQDVGQSELDTSIVPRCAIKLQRVLQTHVSKFRFSIGGHPMLDILRNISVVYDCQFAISFNTFVVRDPACGNSMMSRCAWCQS